MDSFFARFIDMLVCRFILFNVYLLIKKCVNLTFLKEYLLINVYLFPIDLEVLGFVTY